MPGLIPLQLACTATLGQRLWRRGSVERASLHARAGLQALPGFENTSQCPASPATASAENGAVLTKR